MNWMRDIYEEEVRTTSIWKKIGTILGIILFMCCLWCIMTVASAYEDHVRCLNGYEEVCIPEDFQ